MGHTYIHGVWTNKVCKASAIFDVCINIRLYIYAYTYKHIHRLQMLEKDSADIHDIFQIAFCVFLCLSVYLPTK